MAQIPNKFLYFSQGSTYRTKRSDEEIRDDSIVFVEDDASIVARQNIFGVRGVYPGQEQENEDEGNTSTKIITTEPLFPVDTNGRPLVGTTVSVRFRYTNSYKTAGSNMCLNVNGTGAYNIYYNGSDYVSTTSANTTFCGYANREIVYTFRVDVVNNVEYPRWVFVSHGYESGNTNTIGYQLRHNSSTLPASDKFYRYRLLFTSADGTKYVPANTSTSTNATASRTVNQRPIDPFGEILYYSTTTSIAAGSNPGATVLWEEYTFSLGYSFNRTGAALVLSYPAPVYIKCAPQADGSAIIDANNPYVQSLPSTKDDKIYIFLGIAYSATSVELMPTHPVYYHDGMGIRSWTGKTIPSKTSELTNDSGFITSSDVESQVYIVTATLTQANNQPTIQADKTFAQITAAHSAGKAVMVLVNDQVQFPLTSIVGDEVTFTKALLPNYSQSDWAISALRCNEEDEWTVYSGVFSDVTFSGSYNDLTDKPNISPVGTLNTNNSTAQTVSSSESFSGTINLHKVSKTGSYDDLLNKPDFSTLIVTITSTGSGNNIAYLLGSGISYSDIIDALDDGREVVLKYGDKIYCLSKREDDKLTFSSFQGDDDTYSSFTVDSINRIGYYNGSILTSETALSKGTTSGNGNAVTDISVNGHQITLTKGEIFLKTGDISDWAKASTKPTYTASEVGALPANTHIPEDPVNADWNSTSGLSKILNKPTIVQSVSVNGGSAINPTNGNVDLPGIVTGIYWGQRTLPIQNGMITIPSNIMYGMYDNGLWYSGEYTNGTWTYNEIGTASGQLGDLYVDVAENNKIKAYIWDGTGFREVSPSSLSQFTNDSGYATESYVTAAINALPTPMVFQGTIGTGGTSTTVPGTPTEGDTYKIIEGGQSLTFSGITDTIKVGDTVVYKNSTIGWILIPSGDEPSGTVTSVGLNVPTGLAVSPASITSSGTFNITYASGYSIPTTAKQASWDEKQSALVSGTNIKTIDDVSILGSGDLRKIVYGKYISGGFRKGTFNNGWTYFATDMTLEMGVLYIDVSTKKIYYYDGISLKESYNPDLSSYVNVQSDWNETDVSSDAYILNKPTIPSAIEILDLT